MGDSTTDMKENEDADTRLKGVSKTMNRKQRRNRKKTLRGRKKRRENALKFIAFQQTDEYKRIEAQEEKKRLEDEEREKKEREEGRRRYEEREKEIKAEWALQAEKKKKLEEILRAQTEERIKLNEIEQQAKREFFARKKALKVVHLKSIKHGSTDDNGKTEEKEILIDDESVSEDSDLSSENEQITHDTTGNISQNINFTQKPNPQIEVCHFYDRVGVCRFGMACLRFHNFPQGPTNTILLKNMYSGPGMFNIFDDDNDDALEYDRSDEDVTFQKFFKDVHPEFEKIGKLRNMKVCYNQSLHLRGNVFVQYESAESAQKAYQTFNKRFYGGRRIICEYIRIPYWSRAICGLEKQGRCPKGSRCNFLHCYKNPSGLYSRADNDIVSSRSERSQSTFSSRGRSISSRYYRSHHHHRHIERRRESRSRSRSRSSYDSRSSRRSSSSRRSHQRSSSRYSRSSAHSYRSSDDDEYHDDERERRRNSSRRSERSRSSRGDRHDEMDRRSSSSRRDSSRNSDRYRHEKSSRKSKHKNSEISPNSFSSNSDRDSASPPPKTRDDNGDTNASPPQLSPRAVNSDTDRTDSAIKISSRDKKTRKKGSKRKEKRSRSSKSKSNRSSMKYERD